MMQTSVYFMQYVAHWRRSSLNNTRHIECIRGVIFATMHYIDWYWQCNIINVIFIEDGNFFMHLVAASCPNLKSDNCNCRQTSVELTTSHYKPDLWPLRSPCTAVMRVVDSLYSIRASSLKICLILCHSNKRPSDLDLWPMTSLRMSVMRVFLLHPWTKLEVCSSSCSEDMAHFFVSAFIGTAMNN